MAYDSYLPNNWWGTTSPDGNIAPAFGPNGAIPFDQRGLPTPGATPPSTPANTTPTLPDYSQIQNIIQQINATNQQAQTAANNARIPGQPGLEGQSSNFINQLYGDANNPGRIFANIATGAAERAVGGGYSGSPFGGVMGLRLNEDERLRRGGLAEGYHSAALARNPAAPIANPMQLLLQQSEQMYGAGQNQLNRDLQERIANAEMANRALQNRRNVSAYNNRSGSYGPSLPTDYGRGGYGAGSVSGATTNIPEDTNRFGPTVLPPVSPNIGGLDNWNQMGTFSQDQYNQMLGQNPYFGLPDWQNPFSGDQPDLIGPAYAAAADYQTGPYYRSPDREFEPPRYEPELPYY